MQDRDNPFILVSGINATLISEKSVSQAVILVSQCKSTYKFSIYQTFDANLIHFNLPLLVNASDAPNDKAN